MNMQEFIDKYAIKSSATRIKCRADGINHDQGINWLIVLQRTLKEEAFFFSHGWSWLPEGYLRHPPSLGKQDFIGQLDTLRNSYNKLSEYGKGLLKNADYYPPSAIDILPNLQSDCILLEEVSNEWEFYDLSGLEPSLSNSKVYQVVVHNKEKLLNLLGYLGYMEFLSLDVED